MMRSEAEAIEIVERALAAAEADEADALFVESDRNISRFAGSTIHQNMSEESASLTLRVVIGGRIGVASTTVVNGEGIARAAHIARQSALRSQPLKDFRGLHRAAAPAAHSSAFDEATAGLTPQEKAEALFRMFDAGRGAGVDFAGVYTSVSAIVAAGNSHMIRQAAPLTLCDASVIALRGRESGFATSASRRASSIDLAMLGEEATAKARLLEERKQLLPPGRYDVILEPPALAEVFEWMNTITFSGNAWEDGSSFFAGQSGVRLLDPSMTLIDDPVDPSFLPFPFDAEGHPKGRTPLVDHGVIGGPLVDKIAADRLRFPPTGNAAGLGSEDHGTALHLAMDAGESSREELIGSTERGIWITRFNYVNGFLDPKIALMTGMTRDGTFLVEEGKVTRRLPNLRWTQPMLQAFSHIDGISRDRRIIGAWWNLFGGTIAPVVRIRDWNVTGSQE